MPVLLIFRKKLMKFTQIPDGSSTLKSLGAFTAVLFFLTNDRALGADEILLNGTTSEGVFAFTNFLDTTEIGSRAWSFRVDEAVLEPIETGGELASVRPVAVGLSGGEGLVFGAGTAHAGVGGFAWGGVSDQAARDAMSNGSGFHSLSTIRVEPSVASEGTTYLVELLSLAAFAPDRRFNVTANGLPRVTDWTILAGAPFNRVLEFEVVADANGILLEIAGGSEGDSNPYLAGMALTPILTGASDSDGDGLLDSFEQTIIDAAAGETPPLVLGLNDIKGPNDVPVTSDYDEDGASDAAEAANRTNPVDPDSDDDGLLDGVETNTGTWVSLSDTGTDPLNPDSDEDGIPDGVENPDEAYLDADQPGTDPNLADSDQDGLSDNAELNAGTDPTDPNDRPASAVVSKWSFEDNLADTATLGAFSDDLTDETDGLSYVQGVVGKAVQIRKTIGITNKLSAPDSADLNLSGDWSMEAFVWRDTDNNPANEWERFWLKWQGATEYHWAFRGTSGELIPDGLDLFANNQPVFDHDNTTMSLPSETWVHVALVGDQSDSGTIRGFINGVEAFSTPYVEIPRTSAVMTFGNSGFGDQSVFQFSGYIDEAQIHLGAVTDDYLASRAALLLDAPPVIMDVAYLAGSDTATVTFSSVAGRTYSLEASQDLFSWEVIGADINAFDDMTIFDDESVPFGSTSRFYRVRQLP